MFLFSTKNIKYLVATKKNLKLEAMRLCHDVFLERGYITTPFPNGIIPDKRDKISDYIVAITKNDEVIGTFKIVPTVDFFFKVFEKSLYNDLKTKDIINEIKRCNSAEVGSLAVKKSYRRKNISKGLYKALWIYALLHGIDWYVFGIDEEAINSIKKCGWKIYILGKPLFYMGSFTIPCATLVKEQLQWVYTHNPKYYKFLVSST